MLCGNKYKLNGERKEEYFDRFGFFVDMLVSQ